MLVAVPPESHDKKEMEPLPRVLLEKLEIKIMHKQESSIVAIQGQSHIKD